MYELIPVESKISILPLTLISLIGQYHQNYCYYYTGFCEQTHWQLCEAVLELNANVANKLMCRRRDGYSHTAHFPPTAV